MPSRARRRRSLALRFDRVACPAVHAGQEQVVHLDDLVEQRLAGLDQIAGDQRVALGLGEAAEIAGVIAAPKLAELTDDPWIEVVQTRAGAEQSFDQAQANDVALDHRGIGRFWIVLEPEQAGAGIALRHFDQQIDISPQFLRQTLRRWLQTGRWWRGPPRRRRSVRACLRRQHDLPGAQLVFRLDQQIGARCGPREHPRAASRAIWRPPPCRTALRPRWRRIRCACSRSVGSRPERSRNSTGGRPSWRDR